MINKKERERKFSLFLRLPGEAYSSMLPVALSLMT